ncbi:WXG100 family type VII secretion target [Nocardia callitridis]|uniref:ESAT-6-like protein n=1 Tax=Nocardia callitridis TaxID=648753 RepID=A0ABP9L042_9NOCA
MSSMEYNQAAMTTLFGDLQGFRKKLTENSQDMQSAAKALEVAWTGTDAYNSFHQTHTKWDTEFGDTLVVLDKVAAAVENALHRAVGTDGKIGDGFADL